MAKSVFRQFPDGSLNVNGGLAFIEQTNGWTAHLLADDFWEAPAVAGNSFTSGPHAALALGVAAASDLVTFVTTAVATALGVAGRRLAISPAAYASIAVGVAARTVQTRLTRAVTAIGVASANTAGTFAVMAAAIAGSIVNGIADFFPGSGGSGGYLGAAWHWLNRILRHQTHAVPQHVERSEVETVDGNMQYTPPQPRSPQL